MAWVATDALVLHAFDYLETSRIYRLLTREAGVQSVLARGARRPRSRYGSAIDLFAEGEAQISIRPTRELQTLTSFDVTRARSALAGSISRFTAAAAISELALRFAQDDTQPALYDAVRQAFDAIAEAAPAGGDARDAALAGAWHIVAELGFAPAIDSCAVCHVPVPVESRASFSHPAGGILCTRCAQLHRSNRVLPHAARDALRAWLRGDTANNGGRGLEGDVSPRPREPLSAADGRAHQRLLREFLAEHLGDGRALRAFEIWAGGAWDTQPAAVSELAGVDARGDP